MNLAEFKVKVDKLLSIPGDDEYGSVLEALIDENYYDPETSTFTSSYTDEDGIVYTLHATARDYSEYMWILSVRDKLQIDFFGLKGSYNSWSGTEYDISDWVKVELATKKVEYWKEIEW